MRPPKIIKVRCAASAVSMGTPNQYGSASSRIGSTTMKAAPKKLPMIEPSPPMITMNSRSNERLMLNAAGSHEPRCTKPHSAPATPTMKLLTANALSLACTGRMPITAAATSMSRIAIHSRPIALRTRFFASSPNTARKPRHSRYFCAGDSIGTPNTFRPATLTEPDEESLVNHLMRRNAQSVKNCAASVATARYRPLMRRDGMPNSTPTTVLQTPPSSSEAISGMPSMRAWKLYAA